MSRLEQGQSTKEQPPKKQPWRSELMRKRWADPVERQAMITAQTDHVVYQSTKDKIGVSNRGHKHTEEYKTESSQKNGGVKIRGYAFLLRGAIVREVVGLTTLKKSQVQDLRDDLRRHGDLPRPTKEQQQAARKRAYLKLTPSPESAALVKKILKAGIITADLTFWNELLALYQTEGRALPENLSDQLRLEVFLRARKDKELRIKYESLGKEINIEWFSSSLKEEEKFISANVDDESGYCYDEKGPFRCLGGKKFRPVDVVKQPPPLDIQPSRDGYHRKF